MLLFCEILSTKIISFLVFNDPTLGPYTLSVKCLPHKHLDLNEIDLTIIPPSILLPNVLCMVHVAATVKPLQLFDMILNYHCAFGLLCPQSTSFHFPFPT